MSINPEKLDESVALKIKALLHLEKRSHLLVSSQIRNKSCQSYSELIAENGIDIAT